MFRTQRPYVSKDGYDFLFWFYANLYANHLYNSTFMPIPTPKKFFTSGEKAVWRNLATWALDSDSEMDGGWVELPGPAEWWSEEEMDVDLEGFWFSTHSARGHMDAIRLINSGEDTEGVYSRVLPSDRDLWVMDDTSSSRKTLNRFFTIKK